MFSNNSGFFADPYNRKTITVPIFFKPEICNLAPCTCIGRDPARSSLLYYFFYDLLFTLRDTDSINTGRQAADIYQS